MKKFAALFSAMLMSVAALTACGTADINDVNDRRVYDVNDNNRNMFDVNDYNNRNVYDVNDTDVDDVYDGGTNAYDRNIFNRVGDSPLRNDPDVTDNDNNLFDADRDDTIFDDEEMTRGNRTMNR